MQITLLTGSLLLSAGLLCAQSKPADDSQQTAATNATREAQRQGRVALSPNADQSPSQTISQAVAFERYKEIAAERAAQKEAGGGEERTATAAKRKR